MIFELRNGIPFISIQINHDRHSFLVDNVLIDTGSAGSIFSAEVFAKFDVVPEHTDKVHRIAGVGGYEYVIEKKIDSIEIDGHAIHCVLIQLGEMEYGFEIEGIGEMVYRSFSAVANYGRRTTTSPRAYCSLAI